MGMSIALPPTSSDPTTGPCQLLLLSGLMYSPSVAQDSSTALSTQSCYLHQVQT
eukprot:COSAG02_NODE_16975_length_1039_cov_1.011702_1_plen_53_part_10